MTLGESAQRLAANWQRMAKAFRLAQQERQPSEDEWQLNKAWAEALERCASELASVMAEAQEREPKSVITRVRRVSTPTG